MNKLLLCVVVVVVVVFVNTCKATLLTDEEKQTLLDLHNKARKELSLTCYDDQTLPAAADMHELEWDDNLEVITQQWANECVYEHGDADSDEYDQWYSKYGSVGQNLAGGTNVTSAFINWYDKEAQYYDPANEDCDGGTCYHLTQVLWAESYLIACARPDELVCDKEYLFCNFGPAGNVVGYSVYEHGDACVDMDESYIIDGYNCDHCRDTDSVWCELRHMLAGRVCDDDLTDDCSFSCGVCDGGDEYLLGSCIDTWDNCTDVEDEGWCEEDTTFHYLALMGCKKSCDFTCECVDLKSRCSRYSSSYCDSDSKYFSYMNTYCRATCGYCDIELNFVYTV